MQLTDEQKKTVVQWVKEGNSLSTVQKRLADELKLTLTYIDVRFLLIDLGVELTDQKKAVVPQDLTSPPPMPEEDVPEFEPEPVPGGVRVELDRITRPGTVVSGTAVFSDGTKANWALDQRGRLSLGADKKDYRPSAEDVQEFQQAVSRELQKAGYG